MQETVQVQLRAAGEIKVFIAGGLKLEAGDRVIVEAEKGLEYGVILAPNESVSGIKTKEKFSRKVIRKTNPWDEKQIAKNTAKTKELMNICGKKIVEHNLPMKLIDAEYSFDRSKVIFYFTSENRVDFRTLVRSLASIFRVRIELRQIGVRDEARMLGGHGPCGRELCCMSYLKDFEPVTIKMAKMQNLPLNPSKISGICARLMCCLGYEYKNYLEGLKGMPKLGKEIKIDSVKGKVVAINPLKGTLTVDLGEGKVKEVKLEEIKGG
ncbi:MAG: stage 0 sporulation family protein [Candidatus Omnitrophota bacterium]